LKREGREEKRRGRCRNRGRGRTKDCEEEGGEKRMRGRERESWESWRGRERPESLR
jgi:hypothetical protein